MKNLTCKKCGGAMVFDASAMTAICHYCDTTYVLNHEDTDYFRNFYRQMSSFLSGSDDMKKRSREADELWERADTEEFECDDGRTIEFRHMHRYSTKAADVYVGRRHVAFHFRPGSELLAESYRRITSSLDYPSADTRSLADFFPTVTGGFRLTDGTNLLVISKDENEYPLRLFGTLPGRHVAWIISRMENLCCVLEYNSLVHPKISADTLYINPYTHQAALYGGWWEAGKQNSLSLDRTRILKPEENLIGLRNTAAGLLGFAEAGQVRVSTDVPKALADFINGKPASNAYDDFARWDEMLIKAYGERKFMNLSVTDEQVYKQ